MAHRLKIHVSLKYIRAGTQKNPNFCPVALALKDQIPGVFLAGKRVYVGRVKMTFGRISVNTPSRVSHFVKKFDEKGAKAVKPFSFFLG